MTDENITHAVNTAIETTHTDASEAVAALLARHGEVLAMLDDVVALCEQQTRTIALTSERAVKAEKDLAVARELLELRTALLDACRRNLDAARDDHDADAARMKEERDAATARAEKAEAEVVKMEQANEDMAVSESYAIAEAIRSRDEVGIQLAAAQAEIARMKPVVREMRDIAEADCAYSDGCPEHAWAKHGVCVGCKARKSLAALDAVPGDVLATP